MYVAYAEVPCGTRKRLACLVSGKAATSGARNIHVAISIGNREGACWL